MTGEDIRIERDYYDAWGNRRSAPEATIARLEAVLQRAPHDDNAPPSALPDPVPCFEPDWMARGDRRWGIAVQLYSIRSPRNWGIGDFTDLTHLVRLAAKEGADFVGINPLHALYAADPNRFSPYSPSSREFLNVIYIDPAAMQAMPSAPEAQRVIDHPVFQTTLTSLRDAELVAYPQIAACKDAIFRLVFDAFMAIHAREPDHPLVKGFEQFMTQRGEALRRFALFQALSCTPEFGANWMAWPTEYHDPAGDAVREFGETHARDVIYHAFLQWEADAQLADCAAAARDAGMVIGLYLDIAVGTGPESAEGWSERDNIIPGFHVGAPPDAWNDFGQDWGLAVYDPHGFARSGYAVYRRILSALMRYAAAMRIDHVLGLQRLFLVPAGGAPRDGVYLRFPAGDMANALADESRHHRCLIIGEDLGTVPEGFPAFLAARNVLSCRLLIFAKDGDRFLQPHEYPRYALVSIGTHDLPSFLGYWSDADLTLRTELKLYPDAAIEERARQERVTDRFQMRAAFDAAGLSCSDDPAALTAAAHGFLARTPCCLFAAQMEDVAMELHQPNLPASGDAYPSWRLKLSRDLDAIFADPRTTAIFAAIRRERPRDGGA